MSERLLRMNQVEEQTGLSRTTLFRFLNGDDPTFPKRRYVNGNKRVVVFLESEVQAWITAQSQNTTFDVQ